MYHLGCVLCILLGILSLETCNAWAETNYDFESPTQRLAFVVGNAAYETLDELPSAIIEADEVSKTLSDIGFTVFDARNVTFNDFKEKFSQFMTKIGDDDLVVFYFSGHGFSYGGNSYLVPTKFPDHVLETELPSEFISVLTVATSILRGEHKPGYLLLLLNACRDAAKFQNLEKSLDVYTSELKTGWADHRFVPKKAQHVNHEFLYEVVPGSRSPLGIAWVLLQRGYLYFFPSLTSCSGIPKLTS